MEINWYGYACMRIREAGITLIADPLSNDPNFSLPRLRADVATISHDHSGILVAKGLRGSPPILNSPGEYEVGGVFITGVAAWSDQLRNVVFLYDWGGMTVCHLGRLPNVLSQNQVEALDGVQILFVPISDSPTWNPDQAAEVVGLLEPQVVIPTSYDGPEPDARLLARFGKALGIEPAAPVETFKVGHGNLTQDTQIVLLQRKE